MEMSCPKDLSQWVNENPKAMWFIYDLDLMPEQIHTKEEVCALRGFKKGWEARGLKEAAEHRVQRIGLLARFKSWWLAQFANR